MFKKILSAMVNVPEIRKKIIFTLLVVLVYKFLAVIPIPGSNPEAIASLTQSNSGLAFFSSLMGGGLERFSIILMGLSPYINAVIIIQLLGVIVPKIGQLQKEGEQGQKKITKYTRYLTLPIAFLQSYGMILLMNQLAQGGVVIDTTNASTVLVAMLIATTGTMLLMWLGEIMTEYGISNGISIIIMGGVLAGVPGVIQSYIASENYPLFFGIFIATLAIIYIIIKFTEGNRRIPVVYSRTGRDEKTYFPIRVNQAGMIPIIFAVSIVTFPQILGQIMLNANGATAQKIGTFLVAHFDMTNPSWAFILIYFLLVLAFSFFYVSITFDTDRVAESIQKKGGYIPGIRPGRETSEYFTKVSNHLNLYGGSFLALIAVLPYILGKFLGQGSVDFIISGAGLIIIVAVILDIIRKVDTEMRMFDYSKFH